MALKLETSYMSKDGREIQFKTPKMKILGKNMDKDETHTFVVLSHEIQSWENPCKVNGVLKKITNHTLFVKFKDDVNEDNPLTLALSKQAYNSLSLLGIKQEDVLKCTKGIRESAQDGTLFPIVEWELLNREVSLVQKSLDRDIKELQKKKHNINEGEIYTFLQEYMKKVKPEQAHPTHFVGAYIRKFNIEEKLVNTLVQCYKSQK